MPVTTLISVVFPEPFGPMTAWTVPGSIATSTCASADTPPKRFVTPRMSSRTDPGLVTVRGSCRSTGRAGGGVGRSRARRDAGRPGRACPRSRCGSDDRDHDDQHAEEERVVLAQPLGRRGAAELDAEPEGEREGAHDRACKGAEPTEEREDHHLERLAHDRAAVDHRDLEVGLRREDSGERDEPGRERERRHLRPVGRDAGGAGGDLDSRIALYPRPQRLCTRFQLRYRERSRRTTPIQ